jgi:SAM-dependent methyltransferase
VLEGHRESDAAARALRAIYDDLLACPDVRPGPRVDAVFGRLVRLVLDVPPGETAAVLAHPAARDVVPHLRALCFAGEYELELAWARRIAASARPHDELATFPYVENYRLLGAMEREAVARLADGLAAPAVERVAFVGSGPLPLTAFQLASGTGVRVDNLDRDATALALSQQVAEALGIRGLDFRRVDVDRTGVDLGGYDLVVLAALVGRTPADKARVVRHLATAMAPGALLLARSAHGLRTQLYPEVEVGSLAGFDVLGVVHPTGEVINSVILARKPARAETRASSEDR